MRYICEFCKVQIKLHQNTCGKAKCELLFQSSRYDYHRSQSDKLF